VKRRRPTRFATNVPEERTVRDDVARERLVHERVLILGATPLTQAVAHELARRPPDRTTVVGVVPEGEVSDGVRYPVLGPLERLDKIVRATRPSRIIVDLDRPGAEFPVTPLLESLSGGAIVEDAVDAYERLTGRVPLDALRPGHVIFSKPFRRGRRARVATRALSLSIAVLGLVLSAPLFLVLALAIKLDSAGPVLFVHDRLGRGGRRFQLLKFRTMRPGCPRSEWVRDNDDRITGVGAWLRRFRLDELPQLVNVLRGDMDVVGPRPHPVSNAELFNASIPFYPLRLLVRPGVTGWAQIRYGYANNLEEETEKMRYDLYYIKHRSVRLDLCILLMTLKVVLFGYGVEHAVPARDRAAIGEAA
jgi:exopolysaccharide biosynthesis polyprenyl glycosylphosphotransferase